LKQSAADINYFENSEHYPMDHEHVNIHEIKWSTEYSEQIESFCYRDDFKQKDEIFRSDIKHQIIDKDPNDKISEYIQNKTTNTFNDINHDLTLPDDWSGKHIDDGGWNDKYMQVEEQIGRNYSHNFDNLDNNDYVDDDVTVVVDIKQKYKVKEDLEVKMTIPENTIINIQDEVLDAGDEFLSEEESSVSSGFSEEMMEVLKVNQDCQTEIVFSSKNNKKIGSKSANCFENYQTIFCQMFALLKKEQSNL
jgi:hypothetical protein